MHMTAKFAVFMAQKSSHKPDGPDALATHSPMSTGNSALKMANTAVGTAAESTDSNTNRLLRSSSRHGTKKDAAIGAMIKLIAPTMIVDFRPINRILAVPRSARAQAEAVGSAGDSSFVNPAQLDGHFRADGNTAAG
jgi:hypothetical protein